MGQSKSTLQLLSEVRVGDLNLKNAMALAPLTRSRATEQHVPTEVMGEYYKQRATAGLVISEATGISRQGLGWYCAPGIWNEEQVAQWKPIVAGVHERGSKFAMQLWHMGRQVHSDVTGQQPVSASELAMSGEITAVNGEKKPFETPRSLGQEDIREIVEDYRRAAANAKAAGFDMVEVHAANGYLIDQFIQTVTNKRTDEYGGSIENRLRLLREVVDAVLTVYPSERVGVRLAPNGAFGEMGSPDNIETFSEAVKFLGERKVAYVHILDGLGFGFHKLTEPFTLRMARDVLSQTPGAKATKLMGNAGYIRETAEERLKSGDADMIAFGRLYISNPDLPERFAQNLDGEPPLNADASRETWFHPGYGAKGYTDFPALG